jgi:hypothetical protein
MGTNFYWSESACPTCGHAEEELHIGKSSGGWCFSLHVIPEKGINSLKDWQERFARTNSRIHDEYGDVLTPAEMTSRITNRFGRPFEEQTWPMYRDEADFHAQNDSERGPNGLLRHRIGPYCVGHGDGTYDLIAGVFS